MKQISEKHWSVLSALFGLVCLIAADQLTKYLAVWRLKPSGASVSLIPGVLELYYLENPGAAWGILRHARWFFLVLVLVCVVLIARVYLRLPFERRFRLLRIFLTMFSAGAIGNAIDRARCGYVIDFIWISRIDFPVFNLADCFITTAVALLILVYRKEVLAWLNE